MRCMFCKEELVSNKPMFLVVPGAMEVFGTKHIFREDGDPVQGMCDDCAVRTDPTKPIVLRDGLALRFEASA